MQLMALTLNRTYSSQQAKPWGNNSCPVPVEVKPMPEGCSTDALKTTYCPGGHAWLGEAQSCCIWHWKLDDTQTSTTLNSKDTSVTMFCVLLSKFSFKMSGVNLGFQVCIEQIVLLKWVPSNSEFTAFGFNNWVTSLQTSVGDCILDTR